MKKHDTTDAAAFLTSVHLDPEAPAKVKAPKVEVDPHTLPIDQIVLDPSLLDAFPDLSDRAAADFLFGIYKSPGRDKARNSLLWRRIGSFVADVRRQRQAGNDSPIKEKIKTTRTQRDIASHLAVEGLDQEDVADIVAALKLVAEAKAKRATK